MTPGDGSAAVPSEPRRWRTQIHTIPAQVGSRVECYGLGVYPGPIAYLAFPGWADDGETPPHIGLLPGQVDALLNALRDTRMCFEENAVPAVEEVGPVSEAALRATAEVFGKCKYGVSWSALAEEEQHAMLWWAKETARVLSAAREVKSDG